MPGTPTESILHLAPLPGTRVRVLSDLHLGHDRCEVPPLNELAPLLDGIDILVIAGDFSEEREPAFCEKGQKRREEISGLCGKRGIRLISLAGNHDPNAGPLMLSLWGGKAVVMHGHALYKEGSPWGWEYLHHKKLFRDCIASFPARDHSLEERLQLSSRICQLVLPDIRRGEAIRNRWLRGIMHCFFPPERPLRIVWSWLTCGYRAERFARRYCPEAEVLVLGHFHRSGHWQYGRRRIVNTGAWYKHATPWVADLQDGQLIAYRRAR